jgi:DivIVA domain-containing protein
MELSPKEVASATFSTVKKGFDPDEVHAFLTRASTALEASNQQAASMEARARAAVARIQELSQQAAAPQAPAPVVDESATISRALLMAQRAADQAVADAEAAAAQIRAAAGDESATTLDEARRQAAAIVDEARHEARHSRDAELAQADEAVQSLLARRDFLLSDVDHLEQFVQAQRERLRDTAVTLMEVVEKVPGGLADMRRPLLSASAGPEHDTPSGAARPDAAFSGAQALRVDLTSGWSAAPSAADEAPVAHGPAAAAPVEAAPVAEPAIDATPGEGAPALDATAPLELTEVSTGEIPQVVFAESDPTPVDGQLSLGTRPVGGLRIGGDELR